MKTSQDDTKPQQFAEEFSKFPLKKRRFLERYAESGCIGIASAHAGVSRRTHLNWRKSDRSFGAACDLSLEMAVETLESEAIRRAKDGVWVPVYHNGKEVGGIRRYSDLLLIFLLKAAKPEKYRDHYEPFHDLHTVSDAEDAKKRLQEKFERFFRAHQASAAVQTSASPDDPPSAACPS